MALFGSKKTKDKAPEKSSTKAKAALAKRLLRKKRQLVCKSYMRILQRQQRLVLV